MRPDFRGQIYLNSNNRLRLECPGVDSASNRNKYQESSCGDKERPTRMAGNLNAIFERII
jgi:hypothetical protein